MYRIQLGLAASTQLIGIVLALIEISHLHWLGAIGFFLAGLMAALFFLFLPGLVWDEWWYRALGGIGLCLGIYAAFSASPAANMDLQTTRDGLLEAFIWAGSGHTAHLNAAEQSLAEKGVMTCAIEGTMDLSNLVFELQKANYFGPLMTLADGVASIFNEKKSMNCLTYYYALRKTKPEAFILFESKNRWITSGSKAEME